MNNERKNKLSLYDRKKKDLSNEERRMYEHTLVFSGDKEKLHEYMDGLIRNVMNALKNKKDFDVPIDEKLHKKLYEKVDRSAKLFIKNNNDVTRYGYLFSTYYLHSINEALDDIEEDRGRPRHFIKEAYEEMDRMDSKN